MVLLKGVVLAMRYTEETNNKGSRKLLREFVDFMEHNEYPLNESAERITEFTETRWFRDKSRQTQRNYFRILRDFVEYVYKEEHYPLYPSFMVQEYDDTFQKLLEIKENMNNETEEEEEVMRRIDEKTREEYEDFLRRYEEMEARK